MSEKHKYHEACHKIAELEQELQYYKTHNKTIWEKIMPKKENKNKCACACKQKEPFIAYFAKLNDNAVIPQRSEEGSVGYDLYLSEDSEHIYSGCTALLSTGIVAIPPKGYHWELILRSSTPRKKEGIVLANSVGIIDPSYCGPMDEIKILVLNTNTHTEIPIPYIRFHKGEKIAQLVLRENLIPEVQEVAINTVINKDSRGGFGSTDQKDNK